MSEAVDRYDSLFQFYADPCGVPWRLLKAQAIVESNLNPVAVSPKGAKGIAQFMDATWAQWGFGSPFNPEESIAAQARYLEWLMRELADDLEMALAAYNCGIGRLRDHGFPAMPEETKKYVAKVVALYEKMEDEHATVA